MRKHLRDFCEKSKVAAFMADASQVLKSLGQGSYGKVYKVKRTNDEQCYALKVRQARMDGHAESAHLAVPRDCPRPFCKLQQHICACLVFLYTQETDLNAMPQEERMNCVNEIRLLVSIKHPNVVSRQGFLHPLNST